MSHPEEGCPTFILKEGGVKQTFSTGAQKEDSKQIEGKGAYDLLPTIPLRRLAEIYRKGALKYAPYNWSKGIPLSRYLDSAKRHLDQFVEGMEDEDHIHQTIWHLMGLSHTQEMIRRGILPEELNDLPSMGIDGEEIEVYPGCKCSKWRTPAKGLEIGKQIKDNK